MLLIKMSIGFKLKGPVALKLSASHSSGIVSTRSSPKDQVESIVDNSGIAVMDLTFQFPSHIGKISFRNYYTAWISILVKKGGPVESAGESTSPKSKHEAFLAEESRCPGTSHRKGANGKEGTEYWLDGEFKSEIEVRPIGSSGSLGKCPGNQQNRTGRHDLDRRPWEVAIESKRLMPWPHFEDGSQTHFVIMEGEDFLELKDVLLIRFVLHQPSTTWKRFSIEDIKICKPFPEGYNSASQVDKSLLILRQNTKGALWGQIVEPETVLEGDE